eukprot:SAG31_NODE_3012_length_4788_cov_2.735125_4_plen_558_part_00
MAVGSLSPAHAMRHYLHLVYVATAIGGGYRGLQYPDGPPVGLATSIARAANVVWHTPVWADDGTGSMPIGNGDATAMVWVDANSGDLRLVLGKSDAFDENSKPVKIGVLRLVFDPPLWKSAPQTPVPPPVPPPPPPCRGKSSLYAFNQTNVSAVSIIGDQRHIIKSVRSWHGSAEEAAEVCCSVSTCVAFSFDSQWGLELFSTTATDVTGTPGGRWKTWLSTHDRKPEPPPPPPPAWGAGDRCDLGDVFCQTLDIATSTVTIATKSLTVNISFDLNPPLLDGVPQQHAALLRIHAEGSGSKQIEKVSAVLEPYRKEQPEPFAGPFYQRHCYPRFEHEDVVDSSNDALVWYHWNHINTSYFVDTMRGQGIDPTVDPKLVDPFTHRAFGGRLSSGQTLEMVSGSGGLRVETIGPRDEVAMEVRLLTLERTTPMEWAGAIAKLQPAVSNIVGSSPVDCIRNASVLYGDRAACTTTWEEIIGRNYIQVEEVQSTSVETTRGIERTSAENITTHAVWDRYLSIIQGRTSYAPIKFNGQSFLSNQAGKGWDFREWGTAYWWDC